MLMKPLINLTVVNNIRDKSGHATMSYEYLWAFLY